jgi:hypothetical protein
LVFSIAKKKPNAIARKSTKPIAGLPAKNVKPVDTPIHAPITVGTSDSASSQYVLRRTRFWVSASVWDAPCAIIGVSGCIRWTP